jgi:hypothetical protein
MRQVVITASIIADALDFTGIGHFLYPIDLVVIFLHLLYAGPKALTGLLDMIPVVGVIPIYTILALTYKKDE